MNVQTMAQMAYAQAATPIRTDRGTEFELFVRITRALRKASTAQVDFKQLSQAILENRRLWNTLAADLAEPDNPYPDELKGMILNLANFTQLHSSKVLAGKASTDTLVEINTAMMRGLREGETR